MALVKCRLCLEKFDYSEMVDIFHKTDKNNITLHEKVEYCCGIKVNKQ